MFYFLYDYGLRRATRLIGSFDFGLRLSRVDLSGAFSGTFASNMNGFWVSDPMLQVNENAENIKLNIKIYTSHLHTIH